MRQAVFSRAEIRRFIARFCRYAVIVVILVMSIKAWVNYEELPTSASLLAAPAYMGREDGVLSLAVIPTWDWSAATSARYEKKMNCMHGYFIVQLKIIKAGRLSSDRAITSVWLHQEGRWANLVMEPSGQDQHDQDTFLAVGCASKLFKPLMAVDVIARISMDGNGTYLRAMPAKLKEKIAD